MANELNQNGRGGYQIDKITNTKGGVTLNAYMCAEREMCEESKNWSLDRQVLNEWPQINIMEYFLSLVRPSTPEHHRQQGKCHCFLSS